MSFFCNLIVNLLWTCNRLTTITKAVLVIAFKLSSDIHYLNSIPPPVEVVMFACFCVFCFSIPNVPAISSNCFKIVSSLSRSERLLFRYRSRFQTAPVRAVFGIWANQSWKCKWSHIYGFSCLRKNRTWQIVRNVFCRSFGVIRQKFEAQTDVRISTFSFLGFDLPDLALD